MCSLTCSINSKKAHFWGNRSQWWKTEHFNNRKSLHGKVACLLIVIRCDIYDATFLLQASLSLLRMDLWIVMVHNHILLSLMWMPRFWKGATCTQFLTRFFFQLSLNWSIPQISHKSSIFSLLFQEKETRISFALMHAHGHLLDMYLDQISVSTQDWKKSDLCHIKAENLIFLL